MARVVTGRWRTWAPGLSAVVLFAVLAEALHRTRGHYKTNRVIFVTLALAAFAGLTWRSCPPAVAEDEREGRLERSLAAALLLGTSLLALDDRLLYASVSWAQEGLRFFFVLAWLAAVGLVVLVFRRRAPGGQQALLLLAVVALALARPLVLVASPAPHIDVFTTTDRAVDFLLAGTNPYGAEYPDIYGGKYDYAPGLVYWPGTVVLAALGKLAFGDLRAAWAVADLAIAGAVGWFAARGVEGGRRSVLGLLAAAAWLAFPVGPFVLEQAWVDPAVLALLLFAVLALDGRRLALAGALFGLAAAVKQPAALAGVLAAGLVLVGAEAGGRMKDSLRFCAAGALAFAVVVAPFAAGDPEGLLSMTVIVPLGQAMRADSLSLVALMSREWGLGWPGAASGALYLGLLGALVARGAKVGLRGTSAAVVLPSLALLYGAVFLFGKQAFCNYWALTAGLVLAARVVMEPGPRMQPELGPAPPS